jgi:hypothetical protein
VLKTFSYGRVNFEHILWVKLSSSARGALRGGEPMSAETLRHAMIAKDTFAQLKALGDEKLRAQMIKRGAPENQFGVKHGDIRALARGGAWRAECVCSRLTWSPSVNSSAVAG